MADTITMTVRIKKTTKESLETLARTANRPHDVLAAEAIEAFVDLNAWQVEGIDSAVAEADGNSSVPHEEVVAWLRTWGR